jgi:hypothetical protein
MAAHSLDLRQRILSAWQNKENSQRGLAERFKVSLSVTVQGGGDQAASGIDSGEAFSWGSREGGELPSLEARIASVINSRTLRF